MTQLTPKTAAPRDNRHDYGPREHSRNHAGLSLGSDHPLAKLPRETVTVNEQDYQLFVVNTEDDWTALAATWDALLVTTPGHTVFQTFAYQRTWWHHFRDGAELFVVVIVRDGVIEGIAPLQLRNIKRFLRSHRALGFIGSRWQVDRPVLFFPKNATLLHQVLASFLVRHADEWDLFELYEQHADPEGLEALRDAFKRAGCLATIGNDSTCPYLSLTGSWSDFIGGKSSKFRKSLRTSERRLREQGQLQYRLYDTAPEVLEQLEVYRDIEARSWKEKESAGIARDATHLAFYRELAKVFAETRGFLIRMVTVDGKGVVGTFGLEYDGVFYSLQIAYDDAFERCSPGSYLDAIEIEECFARGIKEYDLLGGFLANKVRWTATFRRTKQLHVYRHTAYNAAAFVYAHQFKPWFKSRIWAHVKSRRRRIPVPSNDQ